MAVAAHEKAAVSGPGALGSAPRAGKPVRPAKPRQILPTRTLVRELLLKLDQVAWVLLH